MLKFLLTEVSHLSIENNLQNNTFLVINFLFLEKFIDSKQMKNTSLVLIVILFIAVAGIYILHFSGNKLIGSEKDDTNEVGASSELRIAYIKVDSLVVNYDFAQEMQESFAKQQESYTKEYGEKRNRFESQAAAFQEKVQRGGFLTQESAMNERNRLMGEEQQITKLDQELSTKLAQIQADNNKQLLDSLLTYLKVFNKEKKYSYILNSAEILIGDETHNITKEILVNMNARFSKAKAK